MPPPTIATRASLRPDRSEQVAPMLPSGRPAMAFLVEQGTVDSRHRADRGADIADRNADQWWRLARLSYHAGDAGIGLRNKIKAWLAGERAILTKGRDRTHDDYHPAFTGRCVKVGVIPVFTRGSTVPHGHGRCHGASTMETV